MKNETPKVARFFIFNPLKFGLQEENDTEKVLYFWPQEYTIDKQMADVGLVEALTNFAETFTSEPTSICQTEKVKYILQRPELGWWVVMVVQSRFGEWLDEIGLQNILIHTISQFRLFNGSFERMLENLGEKELRLKLPRLWTPIVTEIELETANIFSSLDGIHFLPVDKHVYLRIQSFVNLIENTFECILYSSFMYKNFLVWSGLEQDDMLKIYKYLIKHLQMNKSQSSGVLQLEEPVPIFLGPNLTSHQLVTIRMNDCFCSFIANWDNATQKNSFLSQLQHLINHQLEMLSLVIGEHAKKNIVQSDEFQYLYFNHMNLAIKNTLYLQTLSADVIRVLNQMHSDFHRDDKLRELIIGTLNEGWIAGRKSDQREFYVYFDQKSAHLLEINEEVKKLAQTYFKDIFID